MTSRITFVGAGDAFGSGGRFNTCFFVETGDEKFFLDFGSSSLIALKRLGIAYETVDKVLLTHLHADHGGGIASLIVEAMIVTRRSTPLTIAGPPGMTDWLNRLKSVMYPGIDRLEPRFDLSLIEMAPGRAHKVGALGVTPYPMRHSPETHPTGLRVEIAGKTIAYTGDGEWSENVVALAQGADLFVSECYAKAGNPPMHMSYHDLRENRDRLDVGQFVLTHFGPEMTDATPQSGEIFAKDGMCIAF